MSSFAPIAVFGYSRPRHMEQMLRSLTACDHFTDSPVTVFIDGPRSPEDAHRVAEVVDVTRNILGNRAVIKSSTSNRGLSRSITSGVSEIIAEYGRVIVVEDDLELSQSFLRYMNAALDRYEAVPNVFHVSGYMFKAPKLERRNLAVMLPMTSTWGWATWSRAWRHYDPAAVGWQRLRTDALLRRRFDLYGAYPYSWLMERQASGLSDSWGIRWYWAVFKAGGLGVFPPKSLVRNIGQDGSGTHGRGVFTSFSSSEESLEVCVPNLPDRVSVDASDLDELYAAIWRQNGGWRGWALHKLRRLMEK